MLAPDERWMMLVFAIGTLYVRLELEGFDPCMVPFVAFYSCWSGDI